MSSFNSISLFHVGFPMWIKKNVNTSELATIMKYNLENDCHQYCVLFFIDC